MPLAMTEDAKLYTLDEARKVLNRETCRREMHRLEQSSPDDVVCVRCGAEFIEKR